MLDEDPFLNSTLAQSIREDCPQLNSNAFVPLDAASPFGFDNSYYKGLQNNMGLLLTDQALSNHPATKPLVDQFASSPADFFQSFVDSVAKMSAIGVLTGDDGEGEIRSICTQIN
jgi:peroxidase